MFDEVLIEVVAMREFNVFNEMGELVSPLPVILGHKDHRSSCAGSVTQGCDNLGVQPGEQADARRPVRIDVISERAREKYMVDVLSSDAHFVHQDRDTSRDSPLGELKFANVVLRKINWLVVVAFLCRGDEKTIDVRPTDYC